MDEKLIEIGARAIYGRRGGVFVERLMDVRDALAALRAAGYEVEKGWQPIETAPRDGTFVLLHVPKGLESGEVTVGAYWNSVKMDERSDSGRFVKGHWDGWLGMDADVQSSWCDPTHWRPLPSPPSVTGRKETPDT